MSFSKYNNDGDFLHFFQKCKFQEDAKDCTSVVGAARKRTQMIFNIYQSMKINEGCTTRLVLESDLDEYSKLVDNKTGLNNYAQFVRSAGNLSYYPLSDCTKWSSTLRSQTVRNLLVELRDEDNFDTDDSNMEDVFITLKTKLNQVNEKFSGEKSPIWKKTAVSNISNSISSSLNKVHFKPNSFSSSEELNTSRHKNNNQSSSGFRTAKTELKIQCLRKHGDPKEEIDCPKETIPVKKSLGGRTRSIHSKFIPPLQNENVNELSSGSLKMDIGDDERLKNLDSKMIELIKNEIMDNGNPITWDDIAGLQFAKTTIQEIVVWPLLRPDIFTGLRRPPKGILLFGPPGTGKTLIGKCIASQSSSTFFSISASSLTSKWIGDSEKLVRTLFAVARCYQPAVIFIDEIDSLLSQRSETEHESSRRIKTEFLVQLDGATTRDDDRILVIGATNRPQELDEAARRRLVKRLYIPLPKFEARCEIVNRLMSAEKNSLTSEDVHKIAQLTDGYSGADMKNLCQEASLGPIRSIDFRQISSIESNQVRPIMLADFMSALKAVRSSVSASDLHQYLEWDKMYGSRGN